MPIPDWLLPTLITAGSAAGNIIGSRQQTGAIERAQAGSSAATQQALQIILALYDQSRNDLSGFRALGGPALQQLSALTFRGRTPGGAPAGGGVDFSKPMPGGSDTNALLQRILGQAGQGANPLNGLNPMAVAQGDSKGAGVRSSIGSAVGGAAGLGIGAALGLGLAPATLGISALVAGVGALVGKLWNNNNPSKEFASNSINEVSKQVWGSDLKGDKDGLVFAVKSGQLPVEAGKKMFNDMWNGWINTMKNGGVDPSIQERSINSQTQWFKPVRDTFNALELKSLQTPQPNMPIGPPPPGNAAPPIAPPAAHPPIDMTQDRSGAYGMNNSFMNRRFGMAY